MTNAGMCLLVIGILLTLGGIIGSIILIMILLVNSLGGDIDSLSNIDNIILIYLKSQSLITHRE